MLRSLVAGLLVSPLIFVVLALSGWLIEHPGWFWWPVGIVGGLVTAAMIVAFVTTPAPEERAARRTPSVDDPRTAARPRTGGLPGLRAEPGNHAQHLRLRRVAARWRFGPPRR